MVQAKEDGNAMGALGVKMKDLVRLACLLGVCCLAALGLHAADDPLTAVERAWLNEHDGRIVLAAENDWPPIAFVDRDGEYKGVSADYVRLLEERLGFRFKIVVTGGLKQILEQARQGRVDVVMNVMSTPQRARYLDFTRSYLRIPTVVLTRKNYEGPADMAGKEVAVPSGYAVIDYLQDHYPALNLVEVGNTAEGLRRLSTGELDAMIGEFPALSFIAEEEGITNLHVAGFTGHEYNLSIGFRREAPMLGRILDKGLALIAAEERARQIGIRGYIMKSVIMKDLATTVRQVLDQAS